MGWDGLDDTVDWSFPHDFSPKIQTKLSNDGSKSFATKMGCCKKEPDRSLKLVFFLGATWLPSWKLTYPLFKCTLEDDDFPLFQVGYVIVPWRVIHFFYISLK